MRKLQLAMFVSFLGCLLTTITGCEPIKTSQCNINPGQFGCNPAFAVQTSRLLLTALSDYKVQLHLADISLYSRLLEVQDQLSVHLDQGEVSLVLPHTVKEPGLAVTVPARLEDKLFHAGPAELRIQIGNERILLPTKLTAPPKFKQIRFTKIEATAEKIAWVGIPDRTTQRGMVLQKEKNANTLTFQWLPSTQPAPTISTCPIIQNASAVIDYQQMFSIGQCYYSNHKNSSAAAITRHSAQTVIADSYINITNGIFPFTEPNLNLMLIFNPTSDNKSAASISVIGIMDSMNSKSNPIPIQLNTGSRNAFAIVTLDASNTAIPYVMIWDANGVRFAFKNPTIENPLTFDIVTNNSLIASLTDRVKQVLTLCSTGNVRFVSGKVTPPVNKHWNDLVVACSSGIYVIERADADSFQVPVQAHLIDAADKLISTLLPAFNRIDIGVLGGTAGEDIVLIQDDVGTRQSDRIDFYVGVE